MGPDSRPGAALTQTRTHVIPATTHGRYLVRGGAGPAPWPVLMAFHGYGEDAEVELRNVASVPGADAWLIASVQALHPFYTRQQRVVASWMTRLDREYAIADNVAYVGSVLASVRAEYATRPPLVLCGFSQGGAMAFRAAAHHGAHALAVLAADVPPEVAAAGVRLPPTLLGRGTTDTGYTEAQHAADVATIRRLGGEVESCVFDGGHEWTDPFRQAVGRLLGRTLG